MKNTSQPVSIIICANNEEDNLKSLLPRLLHQDHPDFEIIVVDDRSFDGTYDYMIKMRDKEEKVKLVKVDELPEHVNGKKYGITLGVKAAKNDILVLTDADCKPKNKRWLQQMVGKFDENTNFVLGYSNYEKKKGLLNTLIRFETLFTGIQYIAEAIAGSPYMGVGRNLAYRKSFFLNNKGFNRHLKVAGGDDDLLVNEFANKRNTKVAVGSKSLVTSQPKKKWSEYFQQKRRHISVGKFYKFKNRFKIGLFSFLFILFYIVFIALLFLQYKIYWVLGGYGIKILTFLILLGVGAKKLGDKYPIWLAPILEIYYIVYLLWGFGVSFSRKKVKWK